MKKIVILALLLISMGIQALHVVKGPAVKAGAKKEYRGIENSIQELGDALIAWYMSKDFIPQDKKVFSNYLSVFIMRYSYKQRLSLIESQKNFFNQTLTKADPFYKKTVDDIDKEYVDEGQQYARFINPTPYLKKGISETSQKFKDSILVIDEQFRNIITTFDSIVPEEYKDFIKERALLVLQNYILNEIKKSPPGGALVTSVAS